MVSWSVCDLGAWRSLGEPSAPTDTLSSTSMDEPCGARKDDGALLGVVPVDVFSMATVGRFIVSCVKSSCWGHDELTHQINYRIHAPGSNLRHVQRPRHPEGPFWWAEQSTKRSEETNDEHRYLHTLPGMS